MPASITTDLSAVGKSISVDDLAADWFPYAGGEPDAACMHSGHKGKSVLVTGAGGWIGAGLTKAIRETAPSRLVLLDHSEHDLSQIYHELVEQTPTNGVEVVPVLGDVCDERLLEVLFRRYQPALIYHLAAVKHVPLAENNPFAVIRTNAIGTYRLALAASEHQPAKLIMVSTDKAANPRSLMGASKRVAELVLLSLTGIGTEMKSVRFGNVFGSRGSVVPLFTRQISQGGPVTITHPDVRRYFLSLRQAINLVLGVARTGYDEHIFVPAFGNQIRIIELAECLIRRAGYMPGTDIQIHFTGLQPGEKLSEDLLSTGEVASTGCGDGLHRVYSPQLAATDLHLALARLEKCIEQFDLAAMLNMIREIIPEYEPSAALLASASAQYCRPEVV
jgi:FlaA1/EpsC-like NDP-sugar epimerase